jgi:hypothetical protein
MQMDRCSSACPRRPGRLTRRRRGKDAAARRSGPDERGGAVRLLPGRRQRLRPTARTLSNFPVGRTGDVVRRRTGVRVRGDEHRARAGENARRPGSLDGAPDRARTKEAGNQPVTGLPVLGAAVVRGGLVEVRASRSAPRLHLHLELRPGQRGSGARSLSFPSSPRTQLVCLACGSAQQNQLSVSRGTRR